MNSFVQTLLFVTITSSNCGLFVIPEGPNEQAASLSNVMFQIDIYLRVSDMADLRVRSS